ncbi:hypothetical protein ACFFF7_09865 [Novosphingobium aquiterrae]|uniref:Transposase n=1 Tax=Novosphingobium aquiterrae TaxID=624388 RepID=A0ABV6PKY8_9SPHN
MSLLKLCEPLWSVLEARQEGVVSASFVKLAGNFGYVHGIVSCG